MITEIPRTGVRDQWSPHCYPFDRNSPDLKKNPPCRWWALKNCFKKHINCRRQRLRLKFGTTFRFPQCAWWAHVFERKFMIKKTIYKPGRRQQIFILSSVGPTFGSHTLVNSFSSSIDCVTNFANSRRYEGKWECLCVRKVCQKKLLLSGTEGPAISL